MPPVRGVRTYSRNADTGNATRASSGGSPIHELTTTSADLPIDGTDTVAIIGAGTIGRSWAVLFAAAGHPVRLFDNDPIRMPAAAEEIDARLSGLAAAGLISDDGAAGEARAGFTMRGSVRDAVTDAALVLECVAESLEIKREVFAELDQLAADRAVLATSSSTIPVSRIAAGIRSRSRCLVIHPANPPYLLKVAEIVPAPFTSEGAVAAADRLLRSAGVRPIRLAREIPGFVFNRLQGALLREAWCLVRDGLVSAADVDVLVTHGLGRRWAVSGPFATSELNTRGGIEQHSQTIGAEYGRMAAERGGDNPWTSEVIGEICAQVHQRLPTEEWSSFVDRRERVLMTLEQLARTGRLRSVPEYPSSDQEVQPGSAAQGAPVEPPHRSLTQPGD